MGTEAEADRDIVLYSNLLVVKLIYLAHYRGIYLAHWRWLFGLDWPLIDKLRSHENDN